MSKIRADIKKLFSLLKNENRYLNKRVKRARRVNFKKALEKVAHIEPEEKDK